MGLLLAREGVVVAVAAAAAAPHKHALTAITLSTADGVDASVRRCEHGTAQRSALQPPPHMIMLAPAEEAAAAWALRERHAAWICLAALSWTVARMTAATRDTPPTQSASQPHASKSSQCWLGGSIGGALHPHPLYISTSPLYIHIPSIYPHPLYISTSPLYIHIPSIYPYPLCIYARVGPAGARVRMQLRS
jgi:hypothetical protein